MFSIRSQYWVQDAVSAQQRSFARAMRKRQVAAGDSSAKSMSHSAGARLYDGQESNGPAKSLSNPSISNGAATEPILMRIPLSTFTQSFLYATNLYVASPQ